jgi:outer membrane autotransporter protein
VAILSNRLFMHEVGRQMAASRGLGTGGASRLALAETCDCDLLAPFSLWFSVLGSVGNVGGDGNAHALRYTIAGGAGGIDYRVSSALLLGVALGYTNSAHYLDGFDSRGSSDGYYAGAYASLNDGAFYFDALAGYAFYDNRMRRGIAFPGFGPRTAYGSARADQYFAQLESGYKFAPATGFTISPFMRLQGSATAQAAFAETGANSLDLAIAARTTNSFRTIPGVDLATQFDVGWQSPLALQLRLGWAHEFIDDFSRPVTASFAGAPAAGFTVVGAVPPRDSAIVGFNATTNIGRSTSLYLRYDGDFNSGATTHAAAVGVRMTW